MKNLKKEFTLKVSKGFTLIELLVVIAIIGILTSIIIVSTGSSRTRAQKAALQKETKGLLNTFNVVCADGDIDLDTDIPDNVTSFDKQETYANGIIQSCGPTGNGTWSVTFMNDEPSALAVCNQDKCTYN